MNSLLDKALAQSGRVMPTPATITPVEAVHDNNSLSTFYGDVLPPEGSYALWTKHNYHNTWFASKDELIGATQDAIDNEAQGVYFATAGFNETAAQNGDKDARTQANVTGKKCFYLDLDAGPGKLAKHGADKVYATQREAIADAVRFFKETDLPPTYLISSGEGLHVYWCLEETVSGVEWTHVARRLSRLFKQFGLKEDSAVTADSARIRCAQHPTCRIE